jgi:hypothetical protein
MGKLLDLLGERRRRQAGNDVVRFFHWADFDQTAICAVKVGQNTMVEQKVTEPFDAFMKRAAAIARDREHPLCGFRTCPSMTKFLKLRARSLQKLVSARCP